MEQETKQIDLLRPGERYGLDGKWGTVQLLVGLAHLTYIQ